MVVGEVYFITQANQPGDLALLMVAMVPKTSSNCRQIGLQYKPPVQKEARKHLTFGRFPSRALGLRLQQLRGLPWPDPCHVECKTGSCTILKMNNPRPQAGDVLFGAVCSALHLAAQNDPVRETTPSAQHEPAIYLSLRPVH